MTAELLADVEDSGEAPTRPDAPAGVEIHEISGPFFFGAAAAFKDTLARVHGKPHILILHMPRVPAMDATGLHALTDVVRRSRSDGTLVLLAEVPPLPLAAIRGSRLRAELGEAQLCVSLDQALSRAREEMAAPRHPRGPREHGTRNATGMAV